jgi:hypothetical protein
MSLHFEDLIGFLIELFKFKFGVLSLWFVIFIDPELRLVDVQDSFFNVDGSILAAGQEELVVLIVLDVSDQSILKTLKSFFFDGLTISEHREVLITASNSTKVEQFDFSLFISDQNLFHEFVVLKNNNFLIFAVVVTKNFFNGAC